MAFINPPVRNSHRAEQIAEDVRTMATRHEISYHPTKTDELGSVYARLAGSADKLDETGYLLLALNRNGHITNKVMYTLYSEYLESKDDV